MTIKQNIWLLAFLWLAALSLCLPAYSAKLATGDHAGIDTVHIKSTARLEFIEGSSTDLTGWLDFDESQPNGEAKGVFRVDLRTLRTGIEMRDQHMRENHLHTETFPYAFFELTGLKGFSDDFLTSDSSLGQADGYFYIHGVKRKLTADLSVGRQEVAAKAVWYQVRARFRLNLDDYEIPRPKALFLKLAETIEVDLIVSLSTEPTPKNIELPDFPLAK